MRFPLLAGSVVVPLLAACAIEPNAPTLQIQRVEGNLVSLEWLPPSRGEFTGFAVERRDGGGEFRRVAELGALQLGHDADLDGAPQGLDIALRVRALPDDDGRRASNVVTHHRQLDTPSISCGFGYGDCWPDQGTLALEISSRHPELALERRTVDCTGAASGWASLPLPPGATWYEDRDLSAWSDGAVLEYRLSAVRGTEQSGFSFARSAAARPFPPAALEASTTPDGTRIWFRNGSRCEVLVTVRTQFDGVVAGSVPVASAPAEADLIVAPSASTVYAYSAESRLAGTPETSDALTSWALAPPAHALGWNVSLLDVSPGALAVRTPSGGFATVGGYGAYAAGPGGADLLAFPLPGTFSVRGSAIAVDDAGHVHVVIRATPADYVLPDVVIHAEHDGTSWTTETLAANAGFASGVALDVGLDGTLRAAWAAWSSLWVATRRIDGWDLRELPGFFASASGFALSGDEAGTPHALAYGGYPDQELWSATATGWERAPVPISPLGVHGFASEAGGRLAVAYTPRDASEDVVLIERDGGGWGTPAVLPGLERPARLVRSRDGSRIAVTSANGVAWLRDASGAATRTWFRISEYAVGFGFDGKLWVLDNMSGSGPLVLFEEP